MNERCSGSSHSCLTLLLMAQNCTDISIFHGAGCRVVTFDIGLPTASRIFRHRPMETSSAAHTDFRNSNPINPHASSLYLEYHMRRSYLRVSGAAFYCPSRNLAVRDTISSNDDSILPISAFI